MKVNNKWGPEEFLLGPMLFNLFIWGRKQGGQVCSSHQSGSGFMHLFFYLKCKEKKDIESVWQCRVFSLQMTLGCSKWYKPDSEKFQKELCKLGKWATSWQLWFSISKCKDSCGIKKNLNFTLILMESDIWWWTRKRNVGVMVGSLVKHWPSLPHLWRRHAGGH